MMNKVIKPSIILMLVAFVSSLVLSHIKKITDPSIKRQATEKQRRALKMVLPGYTVDSKKDKKTVLIGKRKFIFWIASKTVKVKDPRGLEKEVTQKAYAFTSGMPGYSGDVQSMIGVNEKGIILGISILKQTETPGLGDRCTEIASTITFFGRIFGSAKKSVQKQTPWFQVQYRGIDASKKISILKKGDWKPSLRKVLLEKNAITCITGATITSKTVSDSIEHGYRILQKALNILKKKSETRKKEKKK